MSSVTVFVLFQTTRPTRQCNAAQLLCTTNPDRGACNISSNLKNCQKRISILFYPQVRQKSWNLNYEHFRYSNGTFPVFKCDGRSKRRQFPMLAYYLARPLLRANFFLNCDSSMFLLFQLAAMQNDRGCDVILRTFTFWLEERCLFSNC